MDGWILTILHLMHQSMRCILGLQIVSYNLTVKCLLMLLQDDEDENDDNDSLFQASERGKCSCSDTNHILFLSYRMMQQVSMAPADNLIFRLSDSRQWDSSKRRHDARVDNNLVAIQVWDRQSGVRGTEHKVPQVFRWG